MRRNEGHKEKYLDPRWQKVRLQVLERDEWSCQACGDTKLTLHVHHKWYGNTRDGAWRDPWDYPMSALVTLCAQCHEDETEELPVAAETLIQLLKQVGASSDSMHGMVVVFLDSSALENPLQSWEWDVWLFATKRLLLSRHYGGEEWEAAHSAYAQWCKEAAAAK